MLNKMTIQPKLKKLAGKHGYHYRVYLSGWELLCNGVRPRTVSPRPNQTQWGSLDSKEIHDMLDEELIFQTRLWCYLSGHESEENKKQHLEVSKYIWWWLEDVLTDDEGDDGSVLDEHFLIWEKGTDRQAVWHDIERIFKVSIIGDIVPSIREDIRNESGMYYVKTDDPRALKIVDGKIL